MPRATTRRENAPLVQLCGDHANAGEPLGPQVVHDGPQVRSTATTPNGNSRPIIQLAQLIFVVNLHASERCNGRPCA